MKIIVMGCGRVGEQVSRLMASEGHTVVVIDKSAKAMERLGPDFKGRKVVGIGFDRDVLMEAGIEQADAFAATSASDNANVIAARIARTVYQVPRVVARLYDPRRAEIYQRLGLQIISATDLGAERIREIITHADFDPVLSFGAGEVCLLNLEAPRRVIGQMVKHLIVPGEIVLTAITRHGHAFIPSSGTELKSGDMLHLVILTSALERFQQMVGLGEGG
jgi:trk system potassium uptake protein